MTQAFPSHLHGPEALSEASLSALFSPSICPTYRVLRSLNVWVFLCLQPTPCLFVTSPVHASPCFSPPHLTGCFPSQRPWPVPRRRTWRSTRPSTRPCWSSTTCEGWPCPQPGYSCHRIKLMLPASRGPLSLSWVLGMVVVVFQSGEGGEDASGEEWSWKDP